jgi:hypothetical protein
MNPSTTTVREKTTTTRTLGNIATVGKRKCRILPITKKRIGGNVQPITLLTAAQKAALHKALVPKTLPPVIINAKEFLGETIVGHEEGRKIYPLVKKALQQGRKVIISVKGLDLYGGFFDKAICQAYGDFPEDTVDQHVQVVDIEEVDTYTLEDMIEVRKLYYYNREAFDERMRNVDPELGFDEEFDPDFVLDGDPYDPATKGRWIDHETGEEYYI